MAEPRDVLDTPSAGPAALRGGTLRAGGYAAGILLSLIAVPVLIRELGVARFGQYATVLAIVLLVNGVTEGGVTTIALREWSVREGEDRRALMRDLLGVRIGLTALGGIAAVAFAAIAGYGSTLVLGTALAVVGLLPQVVQSLLTVPLQGALRFGWVTAIDLARQAVFVALVVVLALGGAGVAWFLAASIPAALVSLGATTVLVRGQVDLRPRFRASGSRGLLRATIPYAVAVAFVVVYFRVALVACSLLTSELQTGYFATSYRIIEVLAGVPALLIGAAFPILARARRDDDARFDYAAGRVLELALIAGTGAAITLACAAPLVVVALGGHDARPAAAVLEIQAPALAATFLASGVNYALLALERYRVVLTAAVAALLVSLIGSLALVPGLDARGAAVATLGAEVTLALWGLVALVRAQPNLAGALRRAPVVLAAGAVACLPAILGLPAVAATPAAIVLFVVLLGAAGRMPPELREVLRRRS